MNLKKGIAVGLSLSLVLGSNVSALAMPNELIKSLGESKEQIMVLQAQIDQEDGLKSIKESDKVRVVVELESEPVIEIATRKGLKIDEMNTGEVKSIQKSILKVQDTVQNDISNKGIEFEVINTFTNVANGFSIETTLGESRKIQEVKGVKSVTIANEYDRPEPMMNNSGDIINSKETWALGYNGEGTVVAVVDTGVDSTHRDMLVTDPTKAELQIDEVQAIAKDKKLAGTYRTSKVPYGYNYMDQNQEILDLGPDASMHGMHVAGTVGANGDVKNDGIKGVAPEAQILAMKVFGNDPSMSSTFGDVIVKAIDDSVILGADVVNMSLGSTASYVDDTDLEQAAVNRAVDNGVVMAISAGNSNVFGSGYKNPYAANPDYGVVGSPGLATDSIQVASIENNIISGFGLEYEINGVAGIAPYTSAGPDMLEAFKGKNLKVVDCGLGGTSADFTAAVNGNIALIQRGTYTFQDKITNAQNAGAIGVIVYNSPAGGDGLMNMAYQGNLPAIFIGRSHGVSISNESKIKDTTVMLNGKSASAVNPSAGKMSTFTSWGTTPDLEFKPEITAPGGNIWSTANNNGYQNMSGTSMAAPHVAGGSALVLQRVDKEFALTGEARALMAKNLLMSTAKAHVDNGNLQKYGVLAGANYTSPRRQGAGVMDLQAATTTPAIVTDSTSGECKVNLKEILGKSATFTVEIKNYSDKELTYNVAGTVQTDLSDEDSTYLQAQNLVDKSSKQFPISFNNKIISVPAKGSEMLNVTIDLSNAITAYGEVTMEEAFVNGGYVEGFVTLTDPTDNNPDLSIPYVGFKGEWDKAPIIDASIYDEERNSFYGFTAMGTAVGGGDYDFLGVNVNGKVADGNKIAFSPNGDGANDAITPILSYLRNAKELEVEVLNSNGDVIRTIYQDANLTKHYYDGKKPKYSILNEAAWDGKANNTMVKDGQYTYRVKSRIDFEDAKWQNFDFKINVDTVKPTMKSIDYDKQTNQLTVVAEDNNVGQVYKYVLVNEGKEITTNDTGIFNLKDVDYKNCTLEIYDYARNKEVVNLSEAIPGEFKEPTGPSEGDKTIPTVMVSGPEFFGVVNQSKVVVTGTIQDASAISEFTIQGKNTPLKFNTHKGIWEFSAEVELKDGYHSIMVAARDAANNEIGFAHKIFVDTVAPVIEMDNIPKETTDDSIIISGKLTDNLPSLKIKVNGNMVKNIAPDWSYFDTLPSAEHKLAYEVKLVDGENKIIVEALDTAGHVTVKEIIVNKVDKIAPTPDKTAPKAPGLTEEKGLITLVKSDEDTAKIEYSLDNKAWTAYTAPVKVAEKATIYVRAVDGSGNVSEVTKYTVPDRTAPVVPTVPDTTAPKAPVLTEEKGMVTLVVSDQDTRKMEYSLDNKTWVVYTAPVKVAEKGIIYARAIDDSGNVSGVVSYTIPDKTGPKAPVLTEEKGVVTLVGSDEDTAKIEYSLDNKTWTVYTAPVKVAEKGTIYARAIDKAENVSGVVTYTVPDRTSPKSPAITESKGKAILTSTDEDTAKMEYSLDNKIWVAYTAPVEVAEKATIYARAIDQAGNISEVQKYVMSEKEQVKPEEPAKPEEPSKPSKPAKPEINLPQTGGIVGSGLMVIGGIVASAIGALGLRKRK
ncbi:MAG: S8 family serine peptidase [Clostridium sp.]|uniref:S8 family serine peptidase n=1 Tax=Clostridium sp. TaxID=1506 RepID=UPI0030212AB0